MRLVPCVIKIKLTISIKPNVAYLFYWSITISEQTPQKTDVSVTPWHELQNSVAAERGGVTCATLPCAVPIHKSNTAGKSQIATRRFSNISPLYACCVHIYPWRDRANQCHHHDDGCPLEHLCVVNTIFRRVALSLRHHHTSLSPTGELRSNITVSPTKTESVLEPRGRTNFPTNMKQSHKQYLADCLLRCLSHVALTKNKYDIF